MCDGGRTPQEVRLASVVGYLVVCTGLFGVCGGKLKGLDPGGVASYDVAVRETAQVWVVV
jgi:hypothetical protein